MTIKLKEKFQGEEFNNQLEEFKIQTYLKITRNSNISNLYTSSTRGIVAEVVHSSLQRK
jgi:hypothetical protein